MKIYLDVCCSSRPFDDQSQDRIHLELEAILAIMNKIESGQWQLINSDIIVYEISKIPDFEKKNKVLCLISKTDIHIILDDKCLYRAKEIEEYGIKTIDAIHLASAETAEADIFLTTDDNLYKKLKTHSQKFNIKIDNRLSWIKEVI